MRFARRSPILLRRLVIPVLKQIPLAVVLAVLAGAVWAHGDSGAPAAVDPWLAVGSGVFFSIGCIQAFVIASVACSQAGIVGMGMCALAILVMQEVCP